MEVGVQLVANLEAELNVGEGVESRFEVAVDQEEAHDSLGVYPTPVVVHFVDPWDQVLLLLLVEVVPLEEEVILVEVVQLVLVVVVRACREEVQMALVVHLV